MSNMTWRADSPSRKLAFFREEHLIVFCLAVGDYGFLRFSASFGSFCLTIASTNKKTDPQGVYFFIGRGDRIRTCGLHVPNVALYQTEPHLDIQFQNVRYYITHG